MSNFTLDTSNMDVAAGSCERLAEKMEAFKADLDAKKNELLSHWEGKGRNEFEKQYRILTSQLKDISENLWITKQDILTAEESYIQADTDAAKKLEGKTYGKGNLTKKQREKALDTLNEGYPNQGFTAPEKAGSLGGGGGGTRL